MTIVPAIRPCGRGFTIRNICIRFYIKSPKILTKCISMEMLDSIESKVNITLNHHDESIK